MTSSLLVTTIWKRFATGVFWNLLGAVFNQGSTFALGLIVANTLGRDHYGVFSFLLSTILLFMNVAQLAMGFTATKLVAEYRVADKERAGLIIVSVLAVAAASGAVAALIAFVMAPAIAVRVLHDREVAVLLRIGAPAIFFFVLSGACSGILAGFESFRKSAISGVVSGIVYVGVASVLALQGALLGAMAGISISAAFQAVLLLSLVLSEARRQRVSVRWRGLAAIGDERNSLLHIAVPAALTGLSALPSLWISSAILARGPGGVAQLALFTAANSIRLIISFAPQLINGVGFAVLSTFRGIADEQGYRRVFWMNLLTVTSVAAVAATIVIVWGSLFLRMFGPGFADSGPILTVLAVSTIPEALGISLYQVIQTRGLMWKSFFLVGLPRDVSFVLGALLLAGSYGAFGLALSALTASLVLVASTVLLVSRLGVRASE